MNIDFPIAKHLLAWYDKQGRKYLPWREQVSPYRVWISEIMLQQTQVKTVIPYFQRFMLRFPSVEQLANASEDEVLHMWTGLGYYARARNLHRAAQQIVEQYASKFPDTLEKLQQLPGVGRSTAGAILAIAWQKKAAILDGNVKRVLSRFHVITELLTNAVTLKQLWEIAEHYTPTDRVADYTQAIMDLGATVCTRSKPLCEICPIAIGCSAYTQQRQAEFPVRKSRKVLPIRQINMLIFHDTQQNQVFLQKRPAMGIWGGLWGFPECSLEVNIIQWCRDTLSFSIENIENLPTFKHTFSHFQLIIHPKYIGHYHVLPCIMDSNQYVWYNLDKPTARGFAAPVKRLLATLQTS